MAKIIYKTRPRLFILGMSFMGFVFSALLFMFTLQSLENEYDLFVIIILTFFAVMSLTSLFYFFTLKTLTLTKENLMISYFLLPIKQTLNFNEIRNMEQTTKEIKALYGASWKLSYIYTNITTYIHLVDNTQIKLNCIGEIDFVAFYKIYTKLKRGEGKINEPKGYFSLYLVDSLGGLIWLILLLILTIGLGYGMYIK